MSADFVTVGLEPGTSPGTSMTTITVQSDHARSSYTVVSSVHTGEGPPNSSSWGCTYADIPAGACSNPYGALPAADPVQYPNFQQTAPFSVNYEILPDAQAQPAGFSNTYNGQPMPAGYPNAYDTLPIARAAEPVQYNANTYGVAPVPPVMNDTAPANPAAAAEYPQDQIQKPDRELDNRGPLHNPDHADTDPRHGHSNPRRASPRVESQTPASMVECDSPPSSRERRGSISSTGSDRRREIWEALGLREDYCPPEREPDVGDEEGSPEE
ncbi:hypothetical protein HK102_003712 [Quaeritorhiza haematococci]|nr:hypothetical protein HK102_003712 [Quaeritorhiza haematococci]